ncbi:MAG: PDZ domain-containing protein [Mitsuaria chitosanitabida]|uniref:PDZ domain-containing protein n=1 Tax=Roseateles chitosanitabidus TaxID=65048 RepID=UPI001B066F4F|nr:PDZ domain-containing protein [Roseateles chitosanitabidus]MBO9685609.1 PDZ domain-containing protein [Roseateles chitosanitabidus]
MTTIVTTRHQVRSRVRMLVAAGLMVASTLAVAGERGVFGFGLSIESEGFFLNPTLKSVKISKVTPGSPAEHGGLKVGDEVLEVEGRAVAGAKAREIQALAEKDVGQALVVKVRHLGGEIAAITMVPVAKLESK